VCTVSGLGVLLLRRTSLRTRRVITAGWAGSPHPRDVPPLGFFSSSSSSARRAACGRVTTFLVGFGLGAGAGTYFVVLPAIEASTAAVVQVPKNSTAALFL